MKFTISSTTSNLTYLARSWGYKEIFDSKSQRRGYIKLLGSHAFPRFHLFLNPQVGGQLEVDLHLDQLRPLHKKIARASESTGEVVEREADRIRLGGQPIKLI